MQPVPPKSEFSLKEGMSDDVLWAELDRVGISGETRQEVIFFKKPESFHQQIDDIPLHNVLMSNREYAVLRKSYVYVDIFGSVNESWTYYWSGINDEGKYFIRPIKEFPWTEKPKLEEIADWVDRKDDGFERRVQGDVLIKFIHKSDFEEFEVDKPQRQRGFFTSPQSQRELLRQGLFSSFVGTPRPSTTNTSINLMAKLKGSEIRFDRISDSPLKLGNHKLFVDGRVYASKQVPYVCVDADSLILQHQEHKTVEEKIPKEFVAILAAQRGRDFELGNLNYLRSSYD